MTGVILAGGKGSRLGQDKAFLDIEGKSVIEILVSNLSGFFEEVFISANSKGKFKHLKADIIPDIFPDKGPLAGIHAGLVHSGYQYSFVVACDMPFINMDIIMDMINKVEDYDILVPRVKERLHPLCAVYSKRCIPAIEKNLKEGRLRVRDVFGKLKTRIIDMEDDKLFININTKEEYERWFR